MKIDIDRLEKLAKAATPGPWRVLPDLRSVTTTVEGYSLCGPELLIADWIDHDQANEANAAFVAAASPSTIMALLDVFEACRIHVEAGAAGYLYGMDKLEKELSKLEGGS